MSFEQWAEIARTGSITLVFAFLWWTERADRRASEKRERDILRIAKDIPTEE